MNDVDLAIVGGGLAGGLIALALATRRPELRLTLIERGVTLGGDHTWSFHDSDLCDDGAALVAPLISHHWPAQSVAFERHQRRLSTGYNSILSSQFHARLNEALKDSIILGRAVTRLSPTEVNFDSGGVLRAGAVIDCRGAFESSHLALGFQKFVGQVVQLRQPHGIDAPVIMDATVAQLDGYRFVYLLPFDARTIMIEDTRYADGPSLSPEQLRDDITAYATGKGWKIDHVVREETGILPIALGGDINAFWNTSLPDSDGLIARGGMRAGLFHPLTGYSLPDAVALALRIARTDELSPDALFGLTKDLSISTWQSRSFYRLLTRMLFLAAEPDKRHHVLDRFYRLPQSLIERFYAGRSTTADKLRILSGKPPVPVLKALGVLNEAAVLGTMRKKLG